MDPATPQKNKPKTPTVKEMAQQAMADTEQLLKLLRSQRSNINRLIQTAAPDAPVFLMLASTLIESKLRDTRTELNLWTQQWRDPPEKEETQNSFSGELRFNAGHDDRAVVSEGYMSYWCPVPECQHYASHEEQEKRNSEKAQKFDGDRGEDEVDAQDHDDWSGPDISSDSDNERELDLYANEMNSDIQDYLRFESGHTTRDKWYAGIVGDDMIKDYDREKLFDATVKATKRYDNFSSCWAAYCNGVGCFDDSTSIPNV